MNYYVVISEQTIQIIPRWKNKLSNEYLTDKEYLDLAMEQMLDGKFMIPLSRFKTNRVPQKVTIYYGNDTFDTLTDFVDYIYSIRSYQSTKESALKRIRNLAIKNMLQNKKLYGKEISYRFDFIDASNYKLLY